MSWELYGDENFNYMLEIDILKNYSRIFGGCPKECFFRVWVSKRCPDALLAKTVV